MKLTILKEQGSERRVAATPDSVKKFRALGVEVAVVSGAGEGSSFSNSAYEAAGAVIASDNAAAIKDAKIILCVRAPEVDTIHEMTAGSILVGMLAPYEKRAMLARYQEQKIAAMSLELLPRISRAQSMDVLSSQSNLAGYRAVIEAVAGLSKAVPMMMTAAGTIAPAKALVLGAGVAGLQAIATAKRLGAVVTAFDVRPAVKEQVESLGAKFIEVPAEENAETKGGYAKEMSEEYQRRQRQLVLETIVKQDMVISTALIPGKPAPTLITEEMVRGMKAGSVIVDLAAASGGNCPLTVADQVVMKHGVTLIGHTNLPGFVAQDASSVYARNLYQFVSALLLDKTGAVNVQWNDELIAGTLLALDGNVVHPQFKA